MEPLGDIIRLIYEGTATATGNEFFRALVHALVQAMGVRWAFVSEFAGSRDRVKTLAFWDGDGIADNFEYDLEGTVCAGVLEGEIRYYPNNVAPQFPRERALVDMGVESYLAVPMKTPLAGVLGHMAIFDQKPMNFSERELQIFKVFGARAAVELARKHLMEALEESEQRYRDLYEEAPIVYLSVGHDRRIRSANLRAVELFGYTHEELIGMDFSQLTTGASQGRVVARQVFERFLAGEQIWDQEIEMRRANGAQIWISLSGKPIRDALGHPVANRSMLVDITDRKRAEKELVRSERRLKNILESATDAIITIDAAHHIVLFNPAAERVFQCSSGWAIGQPFDRFLSRKFRQLIDRFVDDAKSSKEPLWAPEGITALRVGGEEFPVELTLSPLVMEDEDLYTLILRDITYRQKALGEISRLQMENVSLREEQRRSAGLAEIIGDSPALQSVLEQTKVVAPTDASVLLIGETGTGKELVARALHEYSARKGKLLICVNCAALPGELVESELFGHEKGAFTGASMQRKGRFELADGGTLFLDEIGELSMQAQSKLLRVLQEQSFERVGGTHTMRVDVRLVAATNRDLGNMVGEGSFRADLYYRLNVFPIRIPPLRDRRSDVPLLARHFLELMGRKLGRTYQGIDKQSMDGLMGYSWPGNVRELQNVMERAAILATGPIVNVGDMVFSQPPEIISNTPDSGSLDAVQKAHILTILDQCNWQIEGQRGAAAALGLKPSTLRYRMQKLGIQKQIRDLIHYNR